MNGYTCILCGNDNAEFYHKDATRPYFRCSYCRLVFVPPEYRLSREEEKERYDLHENDPSDEGYRNFLKRIVEPLNSLLPPGSEGLDFGSGPGPALHLMFEERGHSMDLYDPLYENNRKVFDRTYDFITATEVVEHIHNPGKVLDRLWHHLRPEGYLGIMTKRVRNPEAFKSWHYIRDKTHVAFFSAETFEWLSRRWNATLRFEESDVVVFQKNGDRDSVDAMNR